MYESSSIKIECYLYKNCTSINENNAMITLINKNNSQVS